MTIEELVTSMSELKIELKIINDVDINRYNQAYMFAIDMMICKTGNINQVKAEYKHFKSLVH